MLNLLKQIAEESREAIGLSGGDGKETRTKGDNKGDMKYRQERRKEKEKEREKRKGGRE